MPKLIMTVGLPASGKSTWAREQVIASGGRCIRINKDTLRDMLDAGKWSKDREKRILYIRDSIIPVYLSAGISVIVDDTNFAPQHKEALQAIAERCHATFEVVDQFLAVPVGECVRRDAARSVGHVGEHVIRDMWRKYICKPAPPFDPTLPTVALCDLDGTLALLNGRSPYSLQGHINDKLNEKVAETIGALCDTCTFDKVILLSGRDERTRTETTEWIDKIKYSGFNSTDLFMRAANDTRADYIVKRELYNRHILGRYNVWAVFDDRDQVVDLWRELGLACFQVADGAF